MVAVVSWHNTWIGCHGRGARLSWSGGSLVMVRGLACRGQGARLSWSGGSTMATMPSKEHKGLRQPPDEFFVIPTRAPLRSCHGEPSRLA
jgi:hypothetical protein